MEVKEVAKECVVTMKEDLKKLGADIKTFGNEHPYASFDIGCLAALGTLFMVMDTIMEHKGLTFDWVPKK